MLSLAPRALALGIAATSLAACVQHAGTVTVRPAAIARSRPLPPVLFSPPLALASPEDAVVRVVGPEVSCSGTLVEDDLVLTAHHCVVKRGAHGELTPTLLHPGAVQVELGGDYLPWGNVG